MGSLEADVAFICFCPDPEAWVLEGMVSKVISFRLRLGFSPRLQIVGNLKFTEHAFCIFFCKNRNNIASFRIIMRI